MPLNYKTMQQKPNVKTGSSIKLQNKSNTALHQKINDIAGLEHEYLTSNLALDPSDSDREEKRELLKQNWLESQKDLNRLADNYLRYLKTHCSDILKIYGKSKKFLYRGFNKSKPGDVFIGNPHSKRNPKDTAKAAQKEFDALLKAQGFNALRSNSIFCTGDFSLALSYGTVYIVFPVNGFSYTWSSKFDDIVLENQMALIGSSYNTHLIRNLFQNMNLMINNLITIENYEAFNTISDELRIYHNAEKKLTANENLTNTRSLILAWKNLAEKFQKIYYAVPDKDYSSGSNWRSSKRDIFNDIQKYLDGISLTSTSKIPNAKDLGFLKTNLSTGILSGHEIYIHGNYIAFESSYYNEFLKKLLF